MSKRKTIIYGDCTITGVSSPADQLRPGDTFYEYPGIAVKVLAVAKHTEPLFSIHKEQVFEQKASITTLVVQFESGAYDVRRVFSGTEFLRKAR